MSTQDLKTFLMKESGDFDKFDISATLKLSDEEINKEIKKIRKGRSSGLYSIIFLIMLVIVKLISMKTGFLNGWLPDWPLIFMFQLFDISLFYQLGKEKRKNIFTGYY